RRRGVTRTWSRGHAHADGLTCDPRWRSRPRLQQCQHLRRLAALDERGPDRRQPARAADLRAGIASLRRGAGDAVEHDARRTRLYLFVQRTTLAVLRHDTIPPLARNGPS